VVDIAARWGFWHTSKLAADYKAMVGEHRPKPCVRTVASQPEKLGTVAQTLQLMHSGGGKLGLTLQEVTIQF